MICMDGKVRESHMEPLLRQGGWLMAVVCASEEEWTQQQVCLGLHSVMHPSAMVHVAPVGLCITAW